VIYLEEDTILDYDLKPLLMCLGQESVAGRFRQD